MTRIRIALVGVGKIARDQHVPALVGDNRFELVATASLQGSVKGVPAFADIHEMITKVEGLHAVSICTPAAARFELAQTAIDAGLHVMVEKPPAATVSEIVALRRRAGDKGVALFATWHSREAAGVEPARQWLAGKDIRSVRITWKEDIRRWHPGQEWILDRGGFGVFDPGINALSIATRILPHELLLQAAWMEVPEGRSAPLRATLEMRTGTAPVKAEFDFLKSGRQTWDISVETGEGLLVLSKGGRVLELPGGLTLEGPDREYPRLYTHFATLAASARSDVDTAPLQLVADAFLVADRRSGDPFAFEQPCAAANG